MIPTNAKEPHRLRYPAIIALGFFLLIVFGALLLCLPISSRSGEVTNFLDAMFTATSATCVTGLVVFDTFQYWTLFGQLVILCLIQIGGLGFMTIITMFSLFLRRRIGLRERGLIQESVNTLYVGGVVRLVRRILFGTLFFEATGAILLSFRFIPQFGLADGILCSIFHSISAFCNAGFDLLGRYGAYSSLVNYQKDPLVLLTLGCLIVIGGIGFLVWDDLLKEKFHFKNYQLHTKIVLTITGALIIGGTILFLIFERDATFKGMDPITAVVNAFFSAVTPRTAGFNSVDTASLTSASLFFTMLLMFIGGSPGSTAGGIKTTTLGVLLISLRSTLRGSVNYNVYGRRLHDSVLRRAVSVLMINGILAFAAIIAISTISPELNLPDVMFEVFSAIGTVGMSTGITRDLNSFARGIIIFLMYCGRVGSLSFALLFTERKTMAPVQKPIEKIVIG